MKRALAVAGLLIALGTACGGDATSEPTPRPEGQRGPILGPIDRTNDTVDKLNEQQQQKENNYGEQEYPGYEP